MKFFLTKVLAFGLEGCHAKNFGIIKNFILTKSFCKADLKTVPVES